MRSENRKTKSTKRLRRSGLSLLEVILAIAVMASSMALLGELLRIGGRHATAAVNMTKAQIYCETVLTQVAVGLIPAASTENVPVETDPDWLYGLEVSTLDLEALLSVRVTVHHADDTSFNPRSASMTRLMIDPSLDLTEQAEEQEALNGATP